MTFPEIKAILDNELPKAILGEDLIATPQALLIDPVSIVSVCRMLHDHKALYFDSLSCLTGIDNGPESNTMEVVYNLYSIPFHLSLMLKVLLDREKPMLESVSDIWKTADWHERETYDLLGIQFLNHPDLRRILLPNDWVGHPLKKDYVEQEIYHGMTVTYDRGEEQTSNEPES